LRIALCAPAPRLEEAGRRIVRFAQALRRQRRKLPSGGLLRTSMSRLIKLVDGRAEPGQAEQNAASLKLSLL
jgi:hypothetical protein